MDGGEGMNNPAQKSIDMEYSKKVAEERKEKGLFGKAVHGMGGSVTGYKAQTLM